MRDRYLDADRAQRQNFTVGQAFRAPAFGAAVEFHLPVQSGTEPEREALNRRFWEECFTRLELWPGPLHPPGRDHLMAGTRLVSCREKSSGDLEIELAGVHQDPDNRLKAGGAVRVDEVLFAWGTRSI